MVRPPMGHWRSMSKRTAFLFVDPPSKDWGLGFSLRVSERPPMFGPHLWRTSLRASKGWPIHRYCRAAHVPDSGRAWNMHGRSFGERMCKYHQTMGPTWQPIAGSRADLERLRGL